jgi:hypothetical protein
VNLITLLDYPLLVFVITMVVLVMSVRVGRAIGRKRLPSGTAGERDDLTLVTNASLTLLALIIGFSFSMALTRYDLRKSYEAEEATAINTEYERAEFLAPDDAAQIRQLLKQYLDQRILFYTVRGESRLEEVDRENAKLQAQMWSSVRTGAFERPSPTVALAVSGMNEVLEHEGYAQAAWWNRIPTGAWSLMVMLAICCCTLIGFGGHERGLFLYAVFPFLVAISFFLIADIDSPRRGVIRVVPHSLISLSQSLQ